MQQNKKSNKSKSYTKKQKGGDGSALDELLNKIASDPSTAQSSQVAKTPSNSNSQRASLLGRQEPADLMKTTNEQQLGANGGLFAQLFGGPEQKTLSKTQQATANIGDKLQDLSTFVQQAAENKVDSKYLEGLSGQQKKTIEFIQGNLNKLGGSDDSSIIKGLSQYLVQTSLKDLDSKFKSDELLTQSQLSKKLLTEVKDMTSTIGDISAKKAIDNSMTTLVKTVSTINDQYKQLQSTTQLPQDITFQQQKLMNELNQTVALDLNALKTKQQQLVEQSQQYTDRFVNYSSEQQNEMERKRVEQLKSANQVSGQIMNSLASILKQDPPKNNSTTNSSNPSKSPNSIKYFNTELSKDQFKQSLQQSVLQILQKQGVPEEQIKELSKTFETKNLQSIEQGFDNIKKNNPNVFQNMTGDNNQRVPTNLLNIYNQIVNILISDNEIEQQKQIKILEATIEFNSQ